MEIPLTGPVLVIRAIPRSRFIQVFTMKLERALLQISAPGGYACLRVNIHLILIQVPTEVVAHNPEPFSPVLQHLKFHCVGIEYDCVILLRVVLSSPLLYFQCDRLT